MRRLLLISLATVPLTGCQFFNKAAEKAMVDSIDSTTVGEVLSSSPDTGATDAEVFADPTVKSTGTSVSADLIKSTDANARTLAVQRSRNDPFASLPIPPPPELAELPPESVGNRVATGGGVSSAGSTGSAGSAGSAGATSTRAARNGGGAAIIAKKPAPTPPPVRVQSVSKPLVKPSPIAVLPPVPQPVVAPLISVSGVVQLGNEPYAILRSGSEPERYVKVGDRIAGGSVRVKRIETLAFEPKVILEENGIEVSKPITADASQAAEATAPVSVPATPVPVAPPVLPVPARQALLPSIPVIPAVGSAPAANPLPGEVPRSIILSAPDATPQALVPGLPVVKLLNS